MAATPLLLHEEEDALWDRLEERSSPRSFDATIDDIIAQYSNPIEYISRQGVTKVDEFRIDEELVLNRIEDDSIVTMGATTPFLDYTQAWNDGWKEKGWVLEAPSRRFFEDPWDCSAFVCSLDTISLRSGWFAASFCAIVDG